MRDETSAPVGMYDTRGYERNEHASYERSARKYLDLRPFGRLQRVLDLRRLLSTRTPIAATARGEGGV